MNKQELINLLLGELGAADITADSPTPTPADNQKTGFIYFTDKEINKMPKSFRKVFRINGCRAHVRKRTDGRYRCSYEIQYAKKPYNNPPISASGTTLEEAKLRFIEKLKNYTPKSDSAPAVPEDFHGFSMYWLKNFHKRKVCDAVYEKSLKRFNIYTKALWKNKMSEISAADIQQLLDSISDRHRLEEDMHSMLNQIFSTAVKFGIIRLNPVEMIYHQNREREHGKLITKDEENSLIEAYSAPWQTAFAVMLYTGLRPGEYNTARIEGEFIVAPNSKRKNGKKEIKRIPITSMLRPYLINVSILPSVNLQALTKRLKKVLPNHKLYDMRTTFQTRCTECHIAEVAIGLFMGNGIGGELKKAYTDVSNEWLISEAKKLNY